MQTATDSDIEADQLTVSKVIGKIGNSIIEKHKRGEDISQEFEQLKGKILSQNTFAPLLACQTFAKLCENSILDVNRATAVLLPMLQNSNTQLYTILVECIFEILLIDVKVKSSKNSGRYVCLYKILPPVQHPILTMFSKETLNSGERQFFLMDQINQVLNHREKLIFENSLEFMKPVLFFIFSNRIYSDTLWKSLLNKGRQGDIIHQEIVLLSRSNDYSSSLFTNDLISKATKYFLKTRDYTEIQNLTLCLIVSTIDLAEKGLSVENPLKTIFRVFLDDITDNNGIASFINLTIMLLADLLQVISPYSCFILIKILKKLIIEHGFGTILALHMVLDGFTQKLSCTGLDKESIVEIEEIFNYVSTKDNNKRFYEDSGQGKFLRNYIFFDDKITAYYEFDDYFKGISDITMKDMIKQANTFFETYPLIARGLFLSNQLRYDAWLEIYSQLIAMNKKSKKMQNTWRMPYLYKVANEMHPKTKNLLLQGLPDFGKDAVNNTLSCLAKTTSKSYAINLYLKLWMVDARTYPMLSDALKDRTSNESNMEKYETQITKAFVIRKICELKPTQHGSELIQLISELLNTAENEITVVLALESLAILCENSVVNIMSTWKAISFKYRYEQRPRVLKSLFTFFSKIPKLYQSSNDFSDFTREIIQKLWSKALYNVENDMSVCGAAIDTLAVFPRHLLLLDDIPELLKKGIKIEIKFDDPNKRELGLTSETQKIELEQDGIAPPEIWINLMENTYRQCIDNVSALIANFIADEIKEFRGGVYIVPENRPEPKDVKNLPEKCVLRAVIQFLLQQSRQQTADDHIICGLLKALVPKFSKTLPPLDWKFLHEFFHNGTEIKHNCIRILANQLTISKSAKEMIENYIRNFDVSNFQEEDIGILFEKLAELTESIDSAIYALFIQKSIKFAQSSDSSNILLEHILNSVSAVFVKNGNDLKANMKQLCDIIEETLISVETTDETFYKFVKLIKCLPLKFLDKIILYGLESKSIASFKKSLVIIKEACSQKASNTDNPLNWLTQAIEQARKKSNLQVQLLNSCIMILSNYKNASKAYQFVMELLTKIQNILGKNIQSATPSTRATDSAKTVKTVIDKNQGESNIGSSIVVLDNCFLLEILIISIITLSGNGFLLKTSIENETDRTLKSFRYFPHSLYNLLKQEIWKENQGRILEAFYQIYLNQDVPEVYSEMIKNAIFCCKKLPYFDQHQI
uniref:CSON007591 protein n=1 Tax=Culicoides sonorensis TaxID=179676 RepID=A0A336MUB9_CULSO